MNLVKEKYTVKISQERKFRQGQQITRIFRPIIWGVIKLETKKRILPGHEKPLVSIPDRQGALSLPIVRGALPETNKFEVRRLTRRRAVYSE